MTTQVTQCPKCHTSFRVTDAQLGIASGAVRCGSCLHIFNAADHWLDASRPAGNELPAAGEPPADSPLAELDNELDNDLLIDETAEQQSLQNIFDDNDFAEDSYFDQLLDEASPDSDHTAADAPISDHSADDLPVQEPTDDTEAAIRPDDNTPLNIDDFLADADEQLIDDNLLIGDTRAESIINTDDDLNELDDTDRPRSPETTSEFSRFFLELDQQETSASAVFTELDDIGDDADANEESWAKKLLDEAESDDQQTPTDPDLPIQPATEPSDELFDDLDHEPRQAQLDPELLDILNDPESELPVAHDEFVLGEQAMIAGERIGDEKSALLAGIEPEPVEIDNQAGRSSWINRAYLASIVIALLLLAGQYLAFNFDRLARDDSYRPLLAKTCALFGCQLPDLNDIRLIRSSNLVVRSHPDKSQALVVDAIMTNHAEFKQPFPVMELQFTDLDGNIVAGRRFAPGEYLAGELVGSRLMPIKQPIHIALEIVDPGEQASNYQLRFHPHHDS